MIEGSAVQAGAQIPLQESTSGV